MNEEFLSHSHVVVEFHNSWELIDIWGNGDIISTLCIKILKEFGLGKASIDQSQLTTAITKRNRNNNDKEIPTDSPLPPSKTPKVKVFFGEQRRLHNLKEQAWKASEIKVSDHEEEESKGQELGSNNPNYKTLTVTR